jgi:hypothetical protein
MSDTTKPRTEYLRKRHIRKRYGDVTPRTVNRMMEDGRLPPPDFYSGRSPLWSERRLEEHERMLALKAEAARQLAARKAAEAAEKAAAAEFEKSAAA